LLTRNEKYHSGTSEKMNEESRLLMQVWGALGDYVRTGEKSDAAVALVRALVDLGYDVEEFCDAQGECPFIDSALDGLAADDEEENEDEDY
jgi:hypothetical protein